MSGKKIVVTGLAAIIATVLACSKQSAPPTSPSATVPDSAAAAGDGSTLKASAPTLVSPLNDVRVDDAPTLVANAATGTYTPATFSYDFELYDPNNVKVATSVVPTPSYQVPPSALDFDKRYTWRVRATYETSTSTTYGPWSVFGSFQSPNGGYIRGSEVYDPLINGKTVGEINGPVTFLPGVGVRLETESSWIKYPVQPGGLVTGEFSALVSGLRTVSNIEEPKNTILSMARDDGSAFNDNPFRMSLDVRGNGAIAWRFIANRANYAETVGAERVAYPFHENLVYFVQVKWDGGSFGATIREGGFNGNTIYDFGKGYGGTYNPNPHSAYLGRPFTPGTRDSPSSWDGAVVRQLWLSSAPRPASANR
jgi:hypothetical protein